MNDDNLPVQKGQKFNILPNTVRKIFKTSEVWQIKDRLAKMVNATEMDYWRRAAGKSKRERVTNERIRGIMEVSHILMDYIKTIQLKWYGHVQRMHE
ncbi:hypothetical protein RN001_004578 [Aquatica leii]|uniref:Uncharacterized protein n=1 Tax=Aquatica leii TaxID=1421715 RepID=A0AAN7PBJ1_9COLE|nr:hypothetical protein RN001_004578 [Aquatica leii]